MINITIYGQLKEHINDEDTGQWVTQKAVNATGQYNMRGASNMLKVTQQP
jgi:hypothetical protein